MGEMPLSELEARLLAEKHRLRDHMEKDQQETTADLLTELLVLYGKVSEHIRPNLMHICEGIAEILPDDLVAKCEDYAIFRTEHNK